MSAVSGAGMTDEDVTHGVAARLVPGSVRDESRDEASGSAKLLRIDAGRHSSAGSWIRRRGGARGAGHVRGERCGRAQHDQPLVAASASASAERPLAGASGGTARREVPQRLRTATSKVCRCRRSTKLDELLRAVAPGRHLVLHQSAPSLASARTDALRRRRMSGRKLLAP